MDWKQLDMRTGGFQSAGSRLTHNGLLNFFYLQEVRLCNGVAMGLPVVEAR
jgi:hypothetical protein